MEIRKVTDPEFRKYGNLLVGHPEGGLPEGSHLGLIGENITI